MNTVADTLLMLPCASATSMMWQVDLSGVIIILILFSGSIYIWSLMFTKFMALKSARENSAVFLRCYRALEHPAELFLDKSGRRISSPLLAVYDQACASLGAVLDVKGIEAGKLYREGVLSHVPLSDRQIRSIQNAAERTVAEQALLLEANMGYLASASNIAPFLGLLGTVIGVMNSFGSMGSGGAMLSEVAPGIASALMTTVVGLLVALPSSLGYNVLSDQVRKLVVAMDNFAQELVGDLERVHIS
jgi:biopolymer transport protein ExbB/TolQ